MTGQYSVWHVGYNTACPHSLTLPTCSISATPPPNRAPTFPIIASLPPPIGLLHASHLALAICESCAADARGRIKNHADSAGTKTPIREPLSGRRLAAFDATVGEQSDFAACLVLCNDFTLHDSLRLISAVELSYRDIAVRGLSPVFAGAHGDSFAHASGSRRPNGFRQRTGTSTSPETSLAALQIPPHPLREQENQKTVLSALAKRLGGEPREC
jgi:hypothetical protein